jgi:hypothetical protein
MIFSYKLPIFICLLFVFSACPTEVADPKEEPKEDDCDTDDCPTCPANCERIAECNEDDLVCDCLCDERTDAGMSEPPTVDAGNTEAPALDAGSGDVPTVDAGNTEAPALDAGSEDVPTVDAGNTEAPTLDAGGDVAPIVDAGSNETQQADAGTPSCPNGTTGDGVTCTDINECDANNGGCDANATCTNAASSGDAPSCTCNNGYQGDGQDCNDVDECAANNGDCHVNASCTDAPQAGDDPICMCDYGYDGDGQSCTDIDECATNNGGCPTNATCANATVPGEQAICTCNAGYSQDVMGNCKPDALDWDVAHTDTNHSIFILNTALDGIFQVEAGDYVGVFYARDNHFLGCGAFTEWHGETTMLAAQGEETGSMESDGGIIDGVVSGGFEMDEEFHWLFWDASSGNTFSLTPIFDSASPNGNTFVPNGISQVVGFESPHPGWIAEITDANHSIFIKPTALNNWPEIEIGDYLGVFFEDSASEPQCGGMVRWEGEFTQIPAYGAEGNGNVEGFTAGKTFQWRVWDASSNTLYDATATYSAAGQDIYAPNGMSFVDNLIETP